MLGTKCCTGFGCILKDNFCHVENFHGKCYNANNKFCKNNYTCPHYTDAVSKDEEDEYELQS